MTETSITNVFLFLIVITQFYAVIKNEIMFHRMREGRCPNCNKKQ